MTRIREVKTNFTAGEISSELLGRGDLRAYENGALSLRNVFIKPTGGVTRRAGLGYIDTAAGYGRLIPFEFNTQQTYLLVITDEQIDVYAGGTKETTIVSPWTESEIDQLAWTQSADTLLLVHPDVPPKTLTRSSGGAWSLDDWDFFTDNNVTNQPYFKFAGSEVTLTPSGTTGSITLTASTDVFAADTALAKKMVRNVRKILETHPLTKNLKPNKPDQWAGERFTVKRYTELRDPSMMAKGITSNVTGSRADIVICDDVEVPNTCDTADKRAELRKRLGEISFVLVPGGTQIYIGTPHTYHSIYADKAREELGEETPFLQNFERFMMPVLNDKEESVWPERFSKIALENMKRQAGPNKFASQMMLQPVNIAEGRLNPKLLKIYKDDLDYTKEIKTLFIGQTKMISATAYWDPAFASAHGDRSVLAILFQDDKANLYLHHLEYIKLTSGSEQDEATQQCETVAHILKKHFVPSLTVETNGIGSFLPGILRNTLAKNHVPCRVRELHNNRPKDLHILEAFDAPLAAQRLHVHAHILQTPFITEMQEWQPGSSKGHDDGLDAVAGAITQSNLRVDRIFGKGGYGWMKNAKTNHKARSDFKI